ncbi:MAG: phosphate-starvation-inducible PsiE family protein [Pseudomonadota bacterium]
MSQDQLPKEFASLNKLAIKAMLLLNGFAHIIIGLALATSVIMFTWLFFKDVQEAAYAHNLVHGFLHALGTLMLLWSVSALITAEIRYLQGSKPVVETFVEVVLVLFLRKLIVMPVQDASPTFEEVGMWVGGAFMLGVIYVLIRWSQKQSQQ